MEYKFTFRDIWSRKVFINLLRRYGIKPYRYYRQRYTTVMAQLPKRFVDETLWPEFQKIDNELNSYLHDVTDRVVKKVLHEDSSDAVVVDKPLQIEMDNSQSFVAGQPETSDKGPSDVSSHNNPTPSQRKKKKSKKRKKKKKKGRKR